APKVINGRINGKFAPGFSGNPGGSPEATRRAFNKQFLTDLALDWQQHGREVFKRVRRGGPAGYLKVCARFVPKRVRKEESGGVKGEAQGAGGAAAGGVKRFYPQARGGRQRKGDRCTGG